MTHSNLDAVEDLVWRESHIVCLELVDAIARTGGLNDYHLLYAVRGDLLARLGRDQEAAESFLEAAELTANVAEQQFLRDRADAGVRRQNAGQNVC